MYKFCPPKNAPFDTKTNSYKVITSRYKKRIQKSTMNEKTLCCQKIVTGIIIVNIALIKFRARRYRRDGEGCLGGIEKNECCGLAAKKAENDSCKWRRGRGMCLEILVETIPILLTESTECFSLFECTNLRNICYTVL